MSRAGAVGAPTVASQVASRPSTRSRTSGGFRRGARSVLWASGWPARTILLSLIAAYRATLSGVLGGHCRFEPSCSTYAAEAIRGRGAFVGAGLAIWRVLRCNPFASGGRDPAPARREYDGVVQRKPT